MKIIVLISMAMLFFAVSCKDQIVSDCETTTDAALNATFSSIQSEVFTPTCATSGCHETNGLDPVLSAGQAYSNIVNVMSSNPPFLFVKPGVSDSSYLLNKIKGVDIIGAQMPINGQPLSQTVIDTIAAWIDNGALNN